MGVGAALAETPKFRAVLLGNVVAVRWLGSPELDTLPAIQRAVLTAAREVRPLYYVGLSNHRSEFRSADVQKAMVKGTVEMLRVLDSMDLVLAGDELSARMTRSLLRGMVTAARLGNRVLGVDVNAVVSKVYIHDRYEPAAERIAAVTKRDARTLREQLVAAGLVADL